MAQAKAFLAEAKKFTGSVFNGPPRDPERIDRILTKLAQVWKQHSDQRLGQLVSNLSHRASLFNYEDDKLEARLDELLQPKG